MSIRWFASFLQDRRAASAVEFGLFAPVLAMMAIGIADLSRGIARKYQLEQASYRVLELVTVGTLQSDYSYVKPDAAAAAGIPEDNITVDNWLECDGERIADFDEICEEEEQTARFLKVTLIDDFEPTFTYGPLGKAFDSNDDGKIRLTSRSTVRIQ